MLGYKTRRFCVRARQRLSSRGRRSGDHRVWALHLKIVQAAKSRAAFCVRFMPALRSCWNALRSITPAVCRIAPNRTACGRLRSYSAVGRDRRSCVLKSMVRLSDFVGSLRACAFLYGDPDGERKGRGGRGTGAAARQSAFLRDRISFAMFSAGSPLGQKVEAALRPRPQTCAKESLTLWTLLIWVAAECVSRGEGRSGTTKA